MMAMTMERGLLVKDWSAITRRSFREKLGQGKCLAVEALGILVVRHEVQQFIAKDRTTTGLQNHKRRPGFDFRRHDAQNVFEILFCRLQKSIVIERPAATHILPRDVNGKSGVFQDSNRGLRYGGMKVGVKCIRPENDRRMVCRS